MTEFRLTYHVRKSIAFQARNLKHAQTLAKSVINTVHRGIDETDFLVLSIEQTKGKADAEAETITKED
jgi:hypothetical protein